MTVELAVEDQQSAMPCCSVLQCVVVCCSVLQCVEDPQSAMPKLDLLVAFIRISKKSPYYIYMYVHFSELLPPTLCLCTYIWSGIGRNYIHQYFTFSTHVRMHIFQNNIADFVYVCTCIESLLEILYVHQNVTLTTNDCKNTN